MLLLPNRTCAIATAATFAAAMMAVASRPVPTSAQVAPPDFTEPCKLTCVIYGTAPAAGVFWIDVCNATTGLIPNSPLGMNVAAAQHPDSLWLGGSGRLKAWRIGSALPAVAFGALPAGTVAMTEDAENSALAGTGPRGALPGSLYRVFPPGGLLGPVSGASPYLGDLAHDYAPDSPESLVGAAFVGWVNSLVDVDPRNGAQTRPRKTSINPAFFGGVGGLAYDGQNQLWGEDSGDNFFAVDRATGKLTLKMHISPLIQDLASTPRCGVAAPPTPTPLPTVPRSPTPTITRPVPSPTAAPATPLVPGRAFFPIIIRENCLRRVRHADIVLVLDTSTSMRGYTSAGRPKSVAAVEAAASFISRLDFAPNEAGDNDQVAVVGFNDTAWLETPLTGDPALLASALADLPSHEHQGTRLDLALERGRVAVLGPGHRQQNKPLMILLTDGLPNRVPTPVAGGSEEDTVVAAAALAKTLGVTIVTIGVGDPASADALSRINADLLGAVASGPHLFYQTPDAEALAAIYSDAAVGVILCPRGRHRWGDPWP